MEGMVYSLFKNSFLELSGSIFNSERVFWVRMVKWEVFLPLAGKMVKVYLQSPGKSSIFQF